MHGDRWAIWSLRAPGPGGRSRPSLFACTSTSRRTARPWRRRRTPACWPSSAPRGGGRCCQVQRGETRLALPAAVPRRTGRLGSAHSGMRPCRKSACARRRTTAHHHLQPVPSRAQPRRPPARALVSTWRRSAGTQSRGPTRLHAPGVRTPRTRTTCSLAVPNAHTQLINQGLQLSNIKTRVRA